MPDAALSEVVTRPYLSPSATGSYTGDESIVESGSTLTLNLVKDADLAVAACHGQAPFTIAAQEALQVTLTKTASVISMHFALDMRAEVQITHPDGSVTPFQTSLDIQGDVSIDLATGKCGPAHVSYHGQSCGDVGCGGSGHTPQGAVTLTDADAAFTFGAPGGTGFEDLIIANNAVTSAAGDTFVTDAHAAAAGAAGVIAGAEALAFAFPPHFGDPGQGITHDDAHVLDAMGLAALAMIADPGSQTVATEATLAATAAGVQLAIEDGLAAYGVVAHPPPGAILLG